jgi:hypothetical protein
MTRYTGFCDGGANWFQTDNRKSPIDTCLISFSQRRYALDFQQTFG